MSLDRADVIRNAKQLVSCMGLNPEEIILSAGAAMVMMGLRKHTNDLDVDVPWEFFEAQKARKGAKKGLMGEYVEWDGITDISPILSKGTVKLFRQEMNGVYFYHPQYLLDIKRSLSVHPDRSPEKVLQDKKDIKALQEFVELIENSENSEYTERLKKASA